MEIEGGERIGEEQDLFKEGLRGGSWELKEEDEKIEA